MNFNLGPDDEIIPVCFMISLGKATAKTNGSNFLAEPTYKKLTKNATFDIVLACFKDKQDDLYEMTYLVTAWKKDAAPLPRSIIRRFKSFDSPEAKEFIEYPFHLFNPFKRAILHFDDREYKFQEYVSILEDWKTSLVDMAQAWN